MSRCRAILVAILLHAMVLPISHAEVSVPDIFGDNMVLQTGRELPFWGTAEPGEEITVAVTLTEPDEGAKAPPTTVTTAADGRWLVKVPPRNKPGSATVTITGKNSLNFSNVLLGDVWICSGQSNMEWPVKASNNHQKEIAAANFPAIRLFKLERSTSLVPQSQLRGKWVLCRPDTIEDFSAVGYFFGRELHQRLKRPVGLIQVAVGGSNCEAWISQRALKSDEQFAPILARADRANQDPNQANNPTRASVLFNGMIAPLQPFAIKGITWYQGESNVSRAHQYKTLFPLLITDWRKSWGQGDFPFLFVQLANFVSDKTKPEHPEMPEDSAWAEMREAQVKALDLPQTGMTVTIDVGDPRDVNPRNKQPVGHRLALNALNVAYGKKTIDRGPVFKSMSIVGTEAVIDFQNTNDDDLIVVGDRLLGFSIASEDKKFVWADAAIRGNQVVVSSPLIENPVAVRYGWGDNPQCNLFNKAKLPAAPFRTDQWTGVTVQNR